MDDLPLLIDQRSASLAASQEDVRAWASGRRVFVSSLITDMPKERAAARTAIEGVGATPIMFEDLGAQDISAEQAYLGGVRSSDVYIGIWGSRYGVRMSTGYSATEAEFIEAEAQGLRLCLFVGADGAGEMDGAQRDLIAGARNLYTTSTWNDPTDLGQRIRRRLTDLASEDLAPWVRLDRAVFRAREIESTGQTINITADIRSSAVHAELVRLRDGRSGPVPYASPSEARQVTVRGLTSRSVSSIGHEEHIDLTVGESQHRSSWMGVNSVPADEVAQRALSDGLFGTSTLGDMTWQKPVDPLGPLRGLSLDDSILRPVASLLLTEHLLRDHAAATVDSVALGPSHQGRRQLRVEWTPLRVYVNEPQPSSSHITGFVAGL